jgi:hypothetical protein
MGVPRGAPDGREKLTSEKRQAGKIDAKAGGEHDVIKRADARVIENQPDLVVAQFCAHDGARGA